MCSRSSKVKALAYQLLACRLLNDDRSVRAGHENRRAKRVQRAFRIVAVHGRGHGMDTFALDIDDPVMRHGDTCLVQAFRIHVFVEAGMGNLHYEQRGRRIGESC